MLRINDGERQVRGRIPRILAIVIGRLEFLLIPHKKVTIDLVG